MSQRRFTTAKIAAGVALAASLAVFGLSRATAEPAAGSAPGPESSLRFAREAWDRDEHGPALAALEAVREGDLADAVALIEARLHAETAAWSKSAAAAERGLTHDPPAEIAARLHAALSRARIRLDELPAAYRAQRAAWKATRSSQYAAELALELARAFEGAGMPGDALRVYRETWERWPLAEASGEAYDASERLTSGTGAPGPDAKLLLRRAHRLRERWRCDLALGVYDRLMARPDASQSARRSAERGRADCLFKRRRYNEAAAAYRALATKDPKDIDAAIRVGRSYARTGDADRAVKEFASVRKRAGAFGRARTDYLTAIVISDSQPARATELFRAVEKQRAAPGLARLARWRLAWGDLQNGQPEQALKRLRPLTRGSIWDVEVQRGRYWSAVARMALDPEKGRADLRKILEALPLSYYGRIAALRLGEDIEIEREFIGPRSPSRADPRAGRARQLAAGGFDDIAQLELISWLGGQRLDREQRLVAAEVLHEVGDHYRAVRTVIDGFGGALEQGVDARWREAWTLAWPRPFDDTVAKAVEEFAFDPALVYAVMREESTYRPAIASPAGAIGLMQIIPPTGKRIARTLGYAPFRAATDLRIPETNIRFGTYYLKSLVGQFSGATRLAIASYNAGPHVVDRWLKRDGPQHPDAFVESVPYSETRRYLRKVLRSYYMYDRLYGKSLPSVASQPAGEANR